VFVLYLFELCSVLIDTEKIPFVRETTLRIRCYQFVYVCMDRMDSLCYFKREHKYSIMFLINKKKDFRLEIISIEINSKRQMSNEIFLALKAMQNPVIVFRFWVPLIFTPCLHSVVCFM